MLLSPIHSEALRHEGTDAPAPHRHAAGQLLRVETGLVTVLTEHSRWTLPPGCVGWVPPHALHGAVFQGPTRGVNFYVDADWAASHLPGDWKVVRCTPLLDALLTELHREAERCRPPAYRDVLADLLQRAPHEALGVPMPAEPRLRRLCEQLLAQPDDRSDLDDWAARLHVSRRTLTRRFLAETGLSWVQWRQQARLMLALERLVAGQSVTTVALAVGYESLSTFVTLFRARMGLSPTAWLARTAAGR